MAPTKNSVSKIPQCGAHLHGSGWPSLVPRPWTGHVPSHAHRAGRHRRDRSLPIAGDGWNMGDFWSKRGNVQHVGQKKKEKCSRDFWEFGKVLELQWISMWSKMIETNSSANIGMGEQHMKTIYCIGHHSCFLGVVPIAGSWNVSKMGIWESASPKRELKQPFTSKKGIPTDRNCGLNQQKGDGS